MPRSHGAIPFLPLFFNGKIRMLFPALAALAGSLPASLPGQDLPSWDSGLEDREVSSREHAVMEANHYLSQGDSAVRLGDLASASSNYRAAVDALPPGDRIGGIRGTALMRFSKTATDFARELIDAGEYPRAAQILSIVLAPGYAPDYAPAVTLQERLSDYDYINRDDTAAHKEKVDEVSQLLIEGRSFLDSGRYHEATVIYSQVLGLDRTNRAAIEGMERAATLRAQYAESAYDQTRGRALASLGGAWESSVPPSRSASLAEAGLELGAPASQDIAAKLTRIIVDQVLFQNATADEALQFLSSRSRDLDLDAPDPSRRGVNFILGAGVDRLQPIHLRLQNIPLLEVVRYVARSIGAQYRIEPFAVRFVAAGETDDSLLTRTFDVPPDFLSTMPLNDGGADPDPFGGGADNQPAFRRLNAQEFLQSNGIAFPEGAYAQYLPSNSRLIVRNTFENLQLVDAMIASGRGQGSKQVVIRVRQLEILDEDLEELGFDWLLGGFELYNDGAIISSGGQPATDPGNFSFVDPDSGEVIGGNRITSGLRSGIDVFRGDALDRIIGTTRSNAAAASAMSQPSPGVLAVAGTLTDPQFQVVIRALSQSTAGDVLAAPSVVTRSGQRARIELIRELMYPTEYDPPELPQTVGVDTAAGSFPVTPATPTAFTVRPVGLTLEVDPIISEDNHYVDLNLMAEFVRFEGFVNYGSPITTAAVNALNIPVDIVITDNLIVMPVFKTNRTTTPVTVQDGATIVVSGLATSSIELIDDKVPIIGDIPLLGRFFRSEVDLQRNKAVIFFVQVEVIDPGGNRLNRPLDSAPLDPP
ncbi:MAG TPA: Amuc_1098 family type IV pilus outer membrane protein [Verrucomicrobiales bacterium]|nr:Amuc_1098 family type IV pilus outer membrane protein [Verrucomicrobiales bacterium]